MINRSDEIREIIIAHLKDEVLEEEQIVLNQWLAEDERNEELFNNLKDDRYLGEKLSEFEDYSPDEAWRFVSRSIREEKTKKLSLRWVARYAAVIIVLVGSISVLKYFIETELNDTIAETHVTDLSPGNAKALLILSDGQEIKLDSYPDSCIHTQDGVLLINNDNIIHYTEQQDAPSKPNVEWHTIKIPRGGEYILSLGDGTRVWLNSDTEIRYPVKFPAEKREVFLIGEAYFDVQQDIDKPFVVNTKGMDVKVLGTSFNVMAYPDEKSVHTTLVEGLVEVLSLEEEAIRIYPGQQAILDKDGLYVNEVNTKLFTSWKDGKFTFKSEPLESVTRKLARWYNVDFVFLDSSIKNRCFTGYVPRYENVRNVFEMLEYTSNVEFIIKGETIEVKEKK